MSASVDYLKRYQAWRTGADDRTMDEAGINPAELTAAINAAIKGLAEFEEIARDRDHWKSNHDAQVSRARVLMDRIDMPFERVAAYNDYAKYKSGYDRYEAIRKLNVPQFAELFKRNLAGERFDDMVDAMVKP